MAYDNAADLVELNDLGDWDVIHVIDLNRLIDGPRARNYASGLSTAEKMHDFCTASSSFYPELARWYDEANDEWLANEVRKREKMEPDQ